METESQPENQFVDESLEMSRRGVELEALQRETEPGEEAPVRVDEFMFMSALLDRSGVLTVILDRRGRIRGFSRACEEATQYTFEDVWGKCLWDLLLVPEEVELFKSIFEKLRAGQGSIEHESHWLTKDGSRRLIAWCSTALFDSKQSLEYVIAIGTDITERRRTEETLRTSEERYRRLVESSPDAILVHYRGNIVFANKAAVALLGASSPDQIIGKPVLGFVHPDSRAIVKERLEKILEEGTELPLIEDRLIRLDGTELHVEAESIFPFVYEGRPAVQVVAREVTAGRRRDAAVQRAEERLREAEEQTREAEARYRQLFEAGVAGICHATMDGRLVGCNKAFAQMLGYESREAVLGLRLPELCVDPADWDAFISQLREQGFLTGFELSLRHGEGGPLWVLANANLTGDGDDAAILVQGTVLERREQRESEEALWEAWQMYDTVVRMSSDAVIVTDLKGRITNVSDRTLELYRFDTAEQLIGRSSFELIAPEDHETAIANLQRTLKEGLVTNTQFRSLRNDGSRFIAAHDTALIRDTRGRPKAFVNIARHLTKRRLVPEAPQPVAQASRQDHVTDSGAVLESGEFENAARATFVSCRKLIGATGGYVALSREGGARDEVIFSEPDGLVGKFDPARQMRMRALRGEAYRTGRTVYRNELSGSERLRLTPGGGLTVDNVLFAPLVIEGEATGLLGFVNKPGGFTENDVRIASAFGEVAAVALYSNRTLEALEASEARFRSVSEIADHAIITADSRESIVSWNRGAEVIFGYSADEALGKRLTIAAPEELRKAYQEAMSQVASEEGFVIVAEAVEMVGRRKDGTEFPLELSLVAWKTGEGIFLTSSIRDITDRRLAQDAVRRLADHDPLTGLANRALFSDHLTLALANANRNHRKLAVIMLDLDRFMDINHALGHNVGDQLLRGVGDRLSGLVRTGDTVARLGGDGFMLLLPGIAEPEHGIKIAEKVLEALRKPFLVNGQELDITASIGVALYPDHGEDVDMLIRNADLAMCRAKDQGGDNIECSDPATDSKGLEGMVLVT